MLINANAVKIRRLTRGRDVKSTAKMGHGRQLSFLTFIPVDTSPKFIVFCQIIDADLTVADFLCTHIKGEGKEGNDWGDLGFCYYQKLTAHNLGLWLLASRLLWHRFS